MTGTATSSYDMTGLLRMTEDVTAYLEVGIEDAGSDMAFIGKALPGDRRAPLGTLIRTFGIPDRRAVCRSGSRVRIQAEGVQRRIAGTGGQAGTRTDRLCAFHRRSKLRGSENLGGDAVGDGNHGNWLQRTAIGSSNFQGRQVGCNLKKPALSMVRYILATQEDGKQWR